MRVVVVGGTGNLGSAFVEALEADTRVAEIRLVARRPAASPSAKSRFVQADIATDDLDPVVEGADAVVHLAWLLQPNHRPTLTWRANAVGSTRLFEAIARRRVPALLYSSSVGAYSPAGGAEVDESWPTDSLPTTAYGREKAYVERVLDTVEARHPDLRVVRMRPAFVFQRRAGSEQLRLFGGPLVPASLLRPGLIPVLPFPAGLRLQAVHAADVAQAFQLALHRGDARGPYNLAAEPVIDGRSLAALLGARRDVPVPPRLVRAALAVGWHARLVAAEPSLFDLAMTLPVMRTDRARTELGWNPAFSATSALGEGLEGMRDGAGGTTAPLARRR
jgi:UDP-glucose 4-epimerase